MARLPQKLTAPEIRLVKCAARGEWWKPGNKNADRNLANAANWGKHRSIRAAVIRSLCVGEQWPGEPTPWPVHAKGIQIEGARILGDLDLEGAKVARPLWIAASAIDGYLKLDDAEVRTIGLPGSLISGISAQRTHVRGSLYLNKGFRATSGLDLRGGTIEGQLSCSGGSFEKTNGRSIAANALHVLGSVQMNRGFSAKGEVNFLRATIGGQLSCDGGTFNNANGAALSCNGATIHSSVFIGKIKANGEVEFVSATIDGQVDCGRSKFSNPDGTALNFNSAKIRDVLFLNNDCEIEGSVNLVNANLGNHFLLNQANLKSSSDIALDARSIIVAGNVYLTRTSIKGGVALVGAKIGGNLECLHLKFLDAQSAAIGVSQANIGAGIAFNDLGFQAGDERRPLKSLDLSHAQCRTYRDSKNSWPVEGGLGLDGFMYERFHECDTSWSDRRAWLLLQPDAHLGRSTNTTFRPQPWIQCGKVLKEMGHDIDARELGMHREKMRASSASTPHHVWLWLQVLRLTIGFGYKPQRAIGWSLALFFFGWVTFALAANLGYMAPRDGDVISYLAEHPQRLPAHYTRFNALVFALDNYLPIIELGQDQTWQPSNIQTGHQRHVIDGWMTEGARFALGHNWTVTGKTEAFVYSKGKVAASPTIWDKIAGNLGWFFCVGGHRIIYWSLEILGWLFVSLYIAGMSGIMKDE